METEKWCCFLLCPSNQYLESFLVQIKVTSPILSRWPVISGTSKPGAGESQIQKPPGLQSEFLVNLHNLMKPWLRTENEKRNVEIAQM